MIDLTDKIALVTGASRGIGKAVAHTLAKQGARVIGTATTSDGAAGISDYLQPTGGRGYALDMKQIKSIDATLAQMMAEVGTPTIVVNNAGITRDNLLLRMSSEEWCDTISVNLNALYYVTKAVLQGMMKARWGRVINIGSVVGHMGNAGQTNYAAAKAGLAGFSRALAKEVGARNITVNTIAPGFIQTDMTAKMSDMQQKALLGHIPLRKMGTVDDIAHAVLFLASEHSGYITGETLHINGGLYMH